MGRPLTVEEAELLLEGVPGLLKHDYPKIDARLLDNLSWKQHRKLVPGDPADDPAYRARRFAPRRCA